MTLHKVCNVHHSPGISTIGGAGGLGGGAGGLGGDGHELGGHIDQYHQDVSMYLTTETVSSSPSVGLEVDLDGCFCLGSLNDVSNTTPEGSVEGSVDPNKLLIH